jgi:hypothetical protein
MGRGTTNHENRVRWTPNSIFVLNSEERKMLETKKKLSFVSVLSSSFILFILIFGVLISGAGAAERVKPGGIGV